MVYATYEDVNLITNVSSSDISNDDIDSLIAEATIELNRKINVLVVRERVSYIDSTRKNTLDGSNTTFYVRNWEGKYLADMNNDGDVDTNDIKVYQVASDGTETELTVSSITHDEGKFVLSSAPSSDVRLYVTYEWCYKDVSTPDQLVKMACVFLTASYCYGKLNIGMAPNLKFGNQSITRDMNSPEYYRRRAYDLINDINDSMYASADSTETF
ncbi:hypothetical protein DRN69_08385 [Candidatus Pacearchaeota archaeon]|nr:MAG: hypothetical protein DRN69_08385 [Candidatus Pacearchaeota archaeon]